MPWNFSILSKLDLPFENNQDTGTYTNTPKNALEIVNFYFNNCEKSLKKSM